MPISIDRFFTRIDGCSERHMVFVARMIRIISSEGEDALARAGVTNHFLPEGPLAQLSLTRIALLSSSKEGE